MRKLAILAAALPLLSAVAQAESTASDAGLLQCRDRCTQSFEQKLGKGDKAARSGFEACEQKCLRDDYAKNSRKADKPGPRPSLQEPEGKAQ